MKKLRINFKLLALLCVGLLFLAGVYGIYSVTTYGPRWLSSTKNSRTTAAKKAVIQGDILDVNGIVLATTDEEGERVYQSDATKRSAIVHLIGDPQGKVGNAVDSFQSSYLLGMETSFFERAMALFNSEQRRGDNVTLTIDSKLCALICREFQLGAATSDKAGAAVVLNYKTGAMLACVSLPVFDPINIPENIDENALGPYWNRALRSTLPPGSTFKIITTAAALDAFTDAATHMYTCTGATQVADRIITDYGNAHHGTLNMEKAFTVSCNNVFAQIALSLGDDKLRAAAEQFGFNDNFLFRDFVVENSVYPTSGRNLVEIAWSGAGQSQVAATPLHMAMIAASVANDGIMMEPRLLEKVVSPAGVIRVRYSAKQYRKCLDVDTAEILQAYMKNVVASGTGTKAKVSGLSIAGKTGSAESSADGKAVTHAWFVGYIDSDVMPYAVCVLVEDGGSGGSVAAPIAGKIFQYIKENYGK